MNSQKSKLVQRLFALIFLVLAASQNAHAAGEIDLYITDQFSPTYNTHNLYGSSYGQWWEPKVPVSSSYYPLAHKFSHVSFPEPIDMVVALGPVGDAVVHPVDFTLIWSDIDKYDSSGVSFDGSFWKPVAPAGYVCLGSVSQGPTGFAKPALDSMVCVREDLAVEGTATTGLWSDLGSVGGSNVSLWSISCPAGSIYIDAFVAISGIAPPTEPVYCLKASATIPLAPTTALLESYMASYGPELVFHPDEYFLPDDPDAIMDRSKLVWMKVDNEDQQTGFSQTDLGDLYAAGGYILDQIQTPLSNPRAVDDDFRMVLSFPSSTKPGDISRAEAYVRAQPYQAAAVELQFWIFYPWNDAGKSHLTLATGEDVYLDPTGTVGRHYSDWEVVHLRVTDKNVWNPGVAMLNSMIISRHSAAEEVSADDPRIQYNGSKPKVYVAKDSHAQYLAPGYTIYDTPEDGFFVTVDLYDLPGSGIEWPTSQPANHTLVSSAWPDIDLVSPDWLFFTGNWGDYLQNTFTVNVEDALFGIHLYGYTENELGNGKPGLLKRAEWMVPCADNANLGALRIGTEADRGNLMALSSAFSPNITDYEITHNGGAISVKALAADYQAQVEVSFNGGAYTVLDTGKLLGKASPFYTPTSDTNTISVKVSARNPADVPVGCAAVSKTYTVTLNDISFPYLVTTTEDDGSAGSLRNKIASVPFGATIKFVEALHNQPIILNSPLVLDKNITIDASDLANGVTFDGQGVTRVLEVNPGVLVSINGVTITGGAVTGNGAGIDNRGYLDLTDVTLKDNHATSNGGALLNLGGIVTFTNSTLVDNSAGSTGGAIYNGLTGAAITLTNTTVTANQSNIGAAIYHHTGSLSLVHATIVNNTAASSTGGIHFASGYFNIENTIIAGNTDTAGKPDLSLGLITANATGQNFIGINASVSVDFPEGPFVGTAANPKDPLLAPLNSYGTVTDGLLPLAGSPVIDTAIDLLGSPAIDQRGELRPYGAGNDIGAIEVLVPFSLVTNDSDDGSPGSLRDVINNTEIGGTLNFDDALDGTSFNLNSALVFTKNIIISTSNLPNGIVLNATATTRVLTINPGVDVTMDGVSITGGNVAGNGGGVLIDQGTLTLTNATVSGNTASSYGGGIINLGGTLVLRNCTFTDNTAGYGGGALYNGNSHATHSQIINSTIYGNNATNGGAIHNYQGDVTLVHTTIVGNTSTSHGGGIYNNTGTLHTDNSIIAANIAPGAVADLFSNTTVDTLGENFIGDNATVADVFPAGPLVGTTAAPKDPLLAPAANNGGATSTLLPQFDSPVVGVASTTINSPVDDQRGDARLAGQSVDIGAVEVPATYGMVSNDLDDGSVGSIREIISSAPIGWTITFDPALDGKSIVLNSLLILDKNVTISASNLSNGLVLDGNDTTVVILIQPAVNATIEGLTITGGMSNSGAGGVSNRGNLSLISSTISHNNSAGYGAGIYNGGIVTLINTTLSENRGLLGAAIYNVNGEINLIHSTVVGNHATLRAGGLYSSSSGILRVENSIIAGNTGPDIGSGISGFGVIIAEGVNFIGNNSQISSVFPVGPLVGTQSNPKTPLLAALADNGGPNETLQPLFGSPVVDAAIYTFNSPVNDQHGTARTKGVRPDIGAVEVPENYGVVTTEWDDGSAGSLRQIIAAAPAGWNVPLIPSLDGKTIVLNSPLVLDKDIHLSAAGLSNGLVLDGNNASKVIQISAGANIFIEGITITQGYAVNGAGIENQGGNLTLEDMMFIDNNATYYGGGIMNIDGSVLIHNSTFTLNSAGYGGGGLYTGNIGTASATLINSTLSGNDSAYGAALYNEVGNLSLIHTTVSNNTATAQAGGIHNNGGALLIENSIIAANTDSGIAADISSYSTITVTGENFVGDNTTVSSALPESDYVGTGASVKDPMLLTLADNGGSTTTQLPMVGSPVVDAAIVTPNSPLNDQRQVTRPQGIAADLGAVELAFIDTDGDGISDADELVLGTNVSSIDTDNDGLVDGAGNVVLVADYLTGVDSNNDGYVDGEQDFGTDPTKGDSDGDHISDGDEVLIYGINPLFSNAGDLAPIGNPDNRITLSDLLIMQRLLTGDLQPSLLDLKLGDMNADDKFNVGDLLLLEKTILSEGVVPAP